MGWAAMEGFVYRPEFVGEEEERALLAEIARLEFGPVRMRGVVARRRVLHYGWLYNFASSRISPGPPLPDVLVPLRGRCAELAGVRSEDLAEALVTEYPVGAGIGWHRDAPLFGLIVAVSLAGRCRLRFRRQDQKAEIEAAPRSAYLLSGPARTEWEHHIPPTRELRYSITYRTLRRRTA